MNYLGIDFGDRYIGLALGRTGSIAVPYKTVENTNSAITEIVSVVASERIDEIVVGWPVSMSGRENERTGITETFIADLKKSVECPIHTMDERLTSKMATPDSSGRRDASAAAHLLQTYLDRYGKSDSAV